MAVRTVDASSLPQRPAGRAHSAVDELAAAQEHFSAALVVAEAAEDRWLQARAAHALAEILNQAGMWSQAREAAGRALRLSQDIGAPEAIGAEEILSPLEARANASLAVQP